MTAPSRSESKLITGLGRRKVREAEGLFLAEGVRVVEELLAAGIGIRLAVLSASLDETERGRALAGVLEGRCTVRRVGAGRLNEMAGTTTSQGVLVVAETPMASLETVSRRGGGTLLVLDAVQDPGNLGTLARSAAAFGCGGLLCLTGTVDPWNAKAVRAAAGAVFRLPVVVEDTAASLEWLREEGFLLLGADAEGDPVESASLAERVALVVGNEGAGLTEQVRAACAGLVAVPMRAGTESLNVAVATGILLYVITRGRE